MSDDNLFPRHGSPPWDLIPCIPVSQTPTSTQSPSWKSFAQKVNWGFAKSHTARFAKPDHQTVAEAAHTYAAAQAPPPHSSNTWPSRNLPTRTDGKMENSFLKLSRRMKVSIFSISLTDCTFSSLKTKKKERTSWEFLDTNHKTQFITEHETRRQRKKNFHQPSPSLSSLASSSSTTGASPDMSPPLTLCVSPPPQTRFISRKIYWFLTRLYSPYCFRIITAPKRTSK